MSILDDKMDTQIDGTLQELGIKFTVLPLPRLGFEVYSGSLPALLINERDKIQRGLNAPTRRLTQYIEGWLGNLKMSDFDSPKTLFRPLFPNLNYAGYINKHFVYINHENKPCLIIGIV